MVLYTMLLDSSGIFLCEGSFPTPIILTSLMDGLLHLLCLPHITLLGRDSSLLLHSLQ